MRQGNPGLHVLNIFIRLILSELHSDRLNRAFGIKMSNGTI